MATVRYSPMAERDLDEIAEYTRHTWGREQADHYLNRIEDCCERLAANPMLGRKCDTLRIALRRMEEASHVIFFTVEEKGIFVVRILHQSMLSELHLPEE